MPAKCNMYIFKYRLLSSWVLSAEPAIAMNWPTSHKQFLFNSTMLIINAVDPAPQVSGHSDYRD